VNTHLRHVFAKLGAPNRVALAAVAHDPFEWCLRRWPPAPSIACSRLLSPFPCCPAKRSGPDRAGLVPGGARREAYQDARRRAGIIMAAVWIQPAPGGDVAVVYLEVLTVVGVSLGLLLLVLVVLAT
jgi:hypothetical protein